MAGLFAKSGAPMAPANMMLKDQALESAKNFYNKWLPVQNMFINQTQTNAPSVKAQAKGLAGASARAGGASATDQLLSRDVTSGASAGSGRFLQDVQKSGDATAAGAGLGETAASGGADQRYYGSLLKGLGIYKQDMANTQQGLAGIGNAQQHELDTEQELNAQTQQGLGQLASLGAMGAAAFMAPKKKEGG
jgi:hypothetical protein